MGKKFVSTPFWIFKCILTLWYISKTIYMHNTNLNPLASLYTLSLLLLFYVNDFKFSIKISWLNPPHPIYKTKNTSKWKKLKV